MPIISMPVVNGVSQTPTQSAWTVETLTEEIRNSRKARRDSNITVGGVAVECLTIRDGEWIARSTRAERNEFTTLRYAQPGGLPFVLINPAQSLRMKDCREWYVQECFNTEGSLRAAIEAGVNPLSEIAEVFLNELAWPSTVFNWQPTEEDYNREVARQTLLASLGVA